jgi:hypothetical protein
VGVRDRLERGLLRDVPGERGQPDHRRDSERGDRRGHGQRAPDAGQPAQVTRARRGVDHADDEEQRRLEHRVRAEQREPREGRSARPEADEQDEQAQLAHGPEREDELEVVLAQRAVPAEEHRPAAQREHDDLPDGEVRVRGREPGDEVHAGLDHRRGVQVRAHGGRRCHRGGQPEVQRDERRLGRCTDEQADDPGRDRGSVRRVREGRREAVRPGGVPDEDDPDEHRQPAGRGDDDRLHGRAPGDLAVVVVADEQVRQDRRKLPEHEQQERVVGRDEPEHRARERHEDTAEPAQPGRAHREVRGAVDQDERTDRTDEQGHEPREGVEPERELDAERRDPLDDLDRPAARGDLARVRERPGCRRRGSEREDPERLAAEPTDQDRCAQRCRKMHGEQQQHVGSVLLWAGGRSVEGWVVPTARPARLMVRVSIAWSPPGRGRPAPDSVAP